MPLASIPISSQPFLQFPLSTLATSTARHFECSLSLFQEHYPTLALAIDLPSECLVLPG